MVPVLSILVLVLIGQAQQDLDTIVLKDGTTLRGIIEEENDETVVLRIRTPGSKGETMISGTTTVRREEIAEIRRIDGAAREEQKAKARAFEERGWEREKRLGRIVVGPAKVAGRDGFVAAGELFVVETTSDGDFAEEACDALQQAYEGYLRHFKVRRTTGAKQRVMIFADRAEYDAFLLSRYGRKFNNPALYDRKSGVIVAYNGVEKEEEARIRKEIREQLARIDAIRKQLTDTDRKNDEVIKENRRKISAAATEEKNRLRREGRATNEMLRQVDEWAREQQEKVNREARTAEKAIAEARGKATAAVEKGRQAIRHNKMVLRNRNRAMFDTLFHECFHAFAAGRLFAGTEIPHWLNEGMAAYFEMSVLEDNELIHGAPHPMFLRVYKEQASNGQLPALAAVLRADGRIYAVTHEGETDRSNGAYAVSWALAHYLSTRMTPDQMDGYINSVAAGADPADALAKALGQPLPRIDEAVRAHVAALR